MHEIGRGVRAFEAAPVVGTLVDLTARSAAPAPEGAPATGGLVVLVDEHEVVSLPEVDGDLLAVVCTTGDAAASLAALGRAQQVPCVLGVSFDGAPPAPGAMVLVDCSKDEGVVEVVDGGAGSS